MITVANEHSRKSLNEREYFGNRDYINNDIVVQI